MKNFKNSISKLLISGTHNASSEQQTQLNKISDAIEYAWNNWDEDIISTYHEGQEKPEFAPESFIENWIDNEDFDADGFDEENLKDLFN